MRQHQPQQHSHKCPGRRREKEVENVVDEVMVEKFQKRFPGTGRIVIANMNANRHIMIKMAKVKNKEKI